MLIGLMGAGKSHVGRLLSKRLNMPFFDADEVFEARTGHAIRDFFATEGEAAFRVREHAIMMQLLESGPCIIASGGGAVLHPATRTALKQRGCAIWLQARTHTLVARTDGDKVRPLLAAGDPADILATLESKRARFYADAASLRIETDHLSPDDICDVITEALARGAFEAQDCLHVDVTPEGAAPYTVMIGYGISQTLGQRIKTACGSSRRIRLFHDVVLSDSIPAITAELAAVGHTDIQVRMLPQGEAAKAWAPLQESVNWLLDTQCDRHTLVCAIGGGVVGDHAGFAASLALRGLDVVHVPTTLLAQVDSAIGGKTGINTHHGKNLVGTFHQPTLVIIDPALLATLPDRAMRAGYAEILKYALIADPHFYNWLEQAAPALLTRDPQALLCAIHASVAAKAATVSLDAKEHGHRALLNFGHTFGHALEASCHYDDRLIHGEAVALGMSLAFQMSTAMGLCPPADCARVLAHLEKLGLPTQLHALDPSIDLSPATLIARMQSDKKASGGKLTFILTEGIGKAFVTKDTNAAILESILTQSRVPAIG